MRAHRTLQLRLTLQKGIDGALERLKSVDSPEVATEADVEPITALAQSILKREWTG